MSIRHQLAIGTLFITLALVLAVDAQAMASKSPSQRAASGFLAPYTNPEQAKRDPNGLYPIGQRMPVSAYSTNDKQRERAAAAGFTADGPHYYGRVTASDKHMRQWQHAQSLGMKGYYRLRVRKGHYRSVKTPEGKAALVKELTNHITDVLSNPKLNDYVDAWYGYQEEVIDRSYKGAGQVSLADQRSYHEFVHDLIKKLDTKKKRPYYVSERRDSSAENMAGNAFFQDGAMKQNGFIDHGGYTDDSRVRGLLRQWGLDLVKVAADADKHCPSYTGYPRAAITTLFSAGAPTNKADRNRAWLTKVITYDVYMMLAIGIDGFNVCSYAYMKEPTTILQQKIYNKALGDMIKAGLGKVFLWGEDRTDVQMTITSGPKTFTWKLFKNAYTAPSMDMRNIQYGDNRYILLVNNSKETISITLSGFPGGLKLQNMLTSKSMDLGTSTNFSIEPLGVRMCKISR